MIFFALQTAFDRGYAFGQGIGMLLVLIAALFGIRYLIRKNRENNKK